MSTGTPDENDGEELPPESSPDEPEGQWLGTWVDGRQVDPVAPPPPVRGPGGAAPVSPWAPVRPPGHAGPPAVAPPPSTPAPGFPDPNDVAPPTPGADDPAPGITVPNISRPAKPAAGTRSPEAPADAGAEKTTQHIPARTKPATDGPAPGATVPNISPPAKPAADARAPQAANAPQDTDASGTPETDHPAPGATVPTISPPAKPAADARSSQAAGDAGAENATQHIATPAKAAADDPAVPNVSDPAEPAADTRSAEAESGPQDTAASGAPETDDPAPGATVPTISPPARPGADTRPPQVQAEAEGAPHDIAAPERTVTFGRPQVPAVPAEPPADAPAPGGPAAGSDRRNLPAAKPTVAIERVASGASADAGTVDRSGANQVPNPPPGSPPGAPYGTGPNTVYDAPYGTDPNAPHGTGPSTVYDAPHGTDPGAPYGTGTGPNAPYGTGPNTVYDAPPYGTAPYGTGPNAPAGPPPGSPHQGLAAPYPGGPGTPPGYPGGPANQPVRSPWQQYSQAQPGQTTQQGPPGPYGPANQAAYQGGPPAQQLYAQPVSPTGGSLPYEPWRVVEPVRGRSRGRIFAACAGVVALALVAAGAVFFFTGDKTHSATSGARLAGGIFTGDPAATSDGRDQELLGAATSGETVVAVGDESDDIAPRAQFLVSTDGGRSFNLAAVHAADGGEPPYGDVPREVAGGTGAWLALGSSPAGTAVWTSTDGRTWTRQPDADGRAFAATDQVNRIVHTGSGFVAVGDSTAGGTTLPVVWRSADGIHWDRAGEPQLGLTKGTLSLVNAAANGNVVIVHGVGTRPVKKKRPAPVDAVWRSADGGRTWQPSQVPQPAGSSGIAIAATRSGVYVARNVPGRYAVVLGSPDGRQWSVAGQIRLPGYGGLLRLAGSDTGLAAAVTSGQQVLLARSSNGAGWQSAGAVPLPSGRTFQDVALTDRSTVLVGREMAADANAVLAVRGAQGQQITVDLSAIPGAVQPDKAVMGVASSGGRAVAVGSTNGHAAAWTSTDGTRWSRVPSQGSVFARPGRQRLLGVTAGSGGWLAVGYNGTTPRRPLVITSANGTTWQAADGADAFKPKHSTPLATYAAASGPAGYVVVGEDSFSAAVWHSADLTTWRRGTGSSGTDLDGTAASGRWMRDVVAGSSGYVAVGGLNDPTVKAGPQDRPAAWTSTDGQVWTLHQLPLPTGAIGGWCDEVAARNGVLMATGTAATPTGSRPFAFVSSDGGSSWAEATLPSAGNSPYSTVSSETTTATGFVVAGTVGRPGATDVVLWTFRTGRGWAVTTPNGTGLSDGGDHKLTGLTLMGTKLLAVGTAADHLGKQPTLWLRPPP